MRHHRLIPALAIIEDSLFPTPGQADEPQPILDKLVVDDSEPLPPLIADVVVRRSSAMRSARPRQPSAGQIWWIALDAGADRPVALLLLEIAPALAHGWLVSAEVAYAGDEDWVLQEEDIHGSLDPRLGMVQLWHQVSLPTTRLDGLAALLRTEVFASLRMLARQAGPATDVRPSPGRVGLTERHGVSFVCGTPLGEPLVDPRHAYRGLYRKLATRLRRAHEEPDGKTSG